jgi:DNA-binding CsgD family transcriptional regulator
MKGTCMLAHHRSGRAVTVRKSTRPVERAFGAGVRLLAADSLPEIFSILNPALAALGFRDFMVVELRDGQPGLLEGRAASHWADARGELLAATMRATGPFFLSDISAPIRFAGRDGFVSRLPWRTPSTYIVFHGDNGVDAGDVQVRAAAHILADYLSITLMRVGLCRRAASDRALTPRQLECLTWVRAGKSAHDIGAILGISAHTVHEHVGQACAKLGVRTRVQAVVEAIALGLLDE